MCDVTLSATRAASAAPGETAPRVVSRVFPEQTASSLVLAVAMILASATAGLSSPYRQIQLPPESHPALAAAAQILARELSLPQTAILTSVPDDAPLAAGTLVLTTNRPSPDAAARLKLSGGALPPEGYAIVFDGGTARIFGQRPRSLLYAAGDFHHWKMQTNGVFQRQPAFALRSASLHGRLPLPDYVATLGINMVIGPAEAPVSLEETLPEVFGKLSGDQQAAVRRSAARQAAEHARIATACHDADVDYYPLLYGNNFSRWSPELYAAALQAFPDARGTDASNSWEKAALCPSAPATWKLVRAYVGEFARRSGADGLYATFWDSYGLFCQCERCAANGLNQFSNELFECVGNYRAALEPGRHKLVVRTWSSGVPHWLNDTWVHAPGNGGPSGEGTDLWGRVIAELPADILLQTKVYQADCQPDPPFSQLLGKAAPHTEIAEYQITGQTTGRFYFPASTVDHTAWTMRRSRELVGGAGGVSLFPGGTRNPRYDLFADIANSINVRAWRELSWNPQANVEQIWQDWAEPIYGEKAAPFIIRALRRSESVVNRLFSALGLGNDTNSGFPGSIQRRETLLKYTNRYFLPEGQEALQPTLGNVERVIAEKEDCLRQIEEMFHNLDQAAPFLTPGQEKELRTRFEWLREFAWVARNLDESLWRYRYLRHLAGMLTTDAAQLRPLAASQAAVREHYRRMFRFDPAQQFSCYDVSLGELPSKPSLGSPLPLMSELYDASLKLIQENLGPDSPPPARRDTP